MRKVSGRFVARRVIDIAMTVTIVILLSSQITGQLVHEWAGICMSVLVVIHIVMNRVWYRNLFKGKYRAARIVQTCVNLALLVCFVLTAVSGMLMSEHAVRFMRVSSMVGRSREIHLAFSHWSFLLISVHLGMHWSMMLRRVRTRKAIRTVLMAIGIVLTVIGLVLSVRSQVYDYMFFKVVFAFADKSKPAALVILENVLMMFSWSFLSYVLSECLKKHGKGRSRVNG